MRREINASGISVFPIGLGAMPLSIQGRPDAQAARAVLRAALDAGVDFIDTANCYCIDARDFGHNERLIADVLKLTGARDRVTVATKGGITRPGGEWVSEASPAGLRSALERSLVDLGVEAIALYQLHAPDASVPFEDSVDELSRLRDEGKIRHVGLSNVDVEQIERARAIVPVVSVQNRCNVLCKRDFRNGLVRHCLERNICYIPYSPVGGGHGHKGLPAVRVLTEIAGKHAASVYQVALAWLLAKGEHLLPIPGASRVESIRDSVKAVDVALTSEDVDRIDRIEDA